MAYSLIVNQPHTAPGNVLGAAFRFVRAYDPDLLRLQPLWLKQDGGIAVLSKGGRPLPLGRMAAPGEVEPGSPFFFVVDGESYKLNQAIAESDLYEIITLFNDLYSGDSFLIECGTSGFSYYRVV